MIPKKNRVSKKLIEKIFKEGRSLVSQNLTFKYILNSNSITPRISFIAPKSIAKFAVKRNLLRRRGYAALKKYINKSPVGLIGAFVFKKYQEDISIIEDEIENILDKIN